MRKQIPNLITLSNLICGVLSIRYAFEGQITIAAILIFAGAFFDFFDGATARMLKVHSEIGKQLDSLADLITFGLAPSFLVMHYFERYEVFAELNFVFIFIPVFSAIRLANFNIDERQVSGFIGLPTPANGFFWAGLAFIDLTTLYPKYLLPVLTISLSFLLVSQLKMFSLKFKNLKWKGNEVRMIFLLISLTIFIRFLYQSIPIIVLLYILVSIINSAINRKNEV